MTADLHRPTPEVDPFIRRRASDRDQLLPIDEEEAAQARIEAERLARIERNRGWSALGRDVIAGGPKWARAPVDAPRRKRDVEEMLRRRGNGTLDIVKLSRREARALGLLPTFRERCIATWQAVRFLVSTFGARR